MWLFWTLDGFPSLWQPSSQPNLRLFKMECCLLTTSSKCGEHQNIPQIFTTLFFPSFTSLKFASLFQLVKRAIWFPLFFQPIAQSLLILLLIPSLALSVSIVSILLFMASFLASWYAFCTSWKVCSTGEMAYC